MKALLCVDFFDDGHSDPCEVIPHCSFDLHFSMGKESKKDWRYIYIYIYIYIHIHTYTHTTNSFCCTSESSTF